jgi:autophagy-related protein 13
MQAENLKIKQIVSEFFSKSLHIVLESRIPFISAQSQRGGGRGGDQVSFLGSAPPSRMANRWFNLQLENHNAVQDRAEPWRRVDTQEPMVVDIFLRHPTCVGGDAGARYRGQRFLKGRPPKRNPTSRGDSWSENDGESFSSQGGISPTLLERWVVHYERRKKPLGTATGLGLGTCKGVVGGGGFGYSKGSGSVNLEGIYALEIGSPGREPGDNLAYPTHGIESPVVYKRTIIILRLLYCWVSALPAHRLFRLANSSHHNQSFSLSYTASAAPPSLSDADETLMLTCSLMPIETQWGRLCVSVAYRKATAMTALEVMPPLLLHIIADYVGSPATDPLRQLSSVGVTPSGGIHGRRGVHVVSSTASIPNSPSFGPHHSWSGSLNKVPGPPPVPRPTIQFASPSSDFHASPPKPPINFHHPSSPSGHGQMPSQHFSL